MREIKFRAWNTEKKIMCYDNEDCEATFWDGAYASDVGMINTRLNMPDCMRKYEYMQYTGLKDKNGKEIYEGDIVSFLDTYSTDNGYAEEYCIGEVAWSEEELCFYVTNRLSAESWEVLDDCCVIGNIFDNPELLGSDTE